MPILESSALQLYILMLEKLSLKINIIQQNYFINNLNLNSDIIMS